MISKSIIKTSIVTVAFALTVSNISLLSFSGGKGTQSDPYQITSKRDMELLADSVNNGNNWSYRKYFKLMNDIEDSIRTVIGLYYDGCQFQGYFDGNEKKIIVSINGIEGIGIFGFTGNNFVVENLNVDGKICGIHFIGGIVASNGGKVINCNNYALMEVERNTGGIVASNGGKVINCNNYGTIDGINRGNTVGGIVGMNDGYISNCMNAGNIKSGGHVGGIVGEDISMSYYVEFCVNIGTVKGDSSDYVSGGVGGICGRTARESKTINCINSGLVMSNSEEGEVGGIIGLSFGEVKNCINTGTVKGKGNYGIGCIVGYKISGIIENCHYDKQICSGE